MGDDILFSPFKLNGFNLKNRIGVAPMTRMSSPGNSIPRQDVLDFLVHRAQNGTAIIYTEAIVTDYESAQGYPNQARLVTQRQIDAWKPVVKSIQQEGAIAVMQMFHCGRMAWPEVNPAGRVIAPMLGGGFGGKEYFTVETYRALLVQKTQRPVSLTYTREESILAHSKRHPFVMHYKTGATKDGKLVAMETELISDAGAYIYLSPWVLLYATVNAAGPYDVTHVKVDTHTVLTNNTFSSANRGFGANQPCFAYECQLDELAEKLGMSPLAIRRKNYLHKGDSLVTGRVLENAAETEATAEKVVAALGRLDMVINNAGIYETHPVVGMVVNQAIRRNDAQLLVVADKRGKLDKLPRAKTLLSKPGLELDVLNAMAKVLLDEGLAKTEGVEGIEELKAALADFSPAQVAERTGVDAELLQVSARQLAGAGNAAILLAYGLPYQGLNKELATAAANLALLAGIPGREGSGLYLCGEKANSQGAIDLGILPQGNGLGAQAMLAAAAEGKLDALYVVAEDPLSSYPDRDKIAKAFDKVPFLVVQDLFLSPTAQQADVVLPAMSFAEKDGTFTNAERRIQRVRRGIPSPGEAKADGAIFASLAGKLGNSLSFTGPAAIFAEIGKETPAYAEFNFNEIGPQGVVWGGETLQPATRKLVAVGGGVAVEGDFQLVTGSALYHSGTVSTKAKGPMAVLAEAYVEFGREDAKTLEVVDGDLVKVTGNGVELKLKAKVDNRLPKGVLFAPYHFAEAQVNRLYKGEAVIAVKVSK